MSDLTIDREILIEAPIDIVWRTITQPDQIPLWFADEADIDVRPAGQGELRFTTQARKAPFVAPLLVETVDPPNRFSFRWSHPEGDAATPSNSVLVTFTLASDGDERTRLRVVETNLDRVPWTDAEKATYAEDHRDGWERHLGRLRAHFASPTSDARA